MMKSILTLLLSVAMATSAYATESFGNCSPNAGILINSVFLCVEGLSAAERKELRDIKRELENITSQRPADAHRINQNLIKLASQGKVHLTELRRTREDIVSRLERIDAKTDELRTMVGSMLAKYQPIPLQPWEVPSPPTELDGKPTVLAIPIPQSAKSLQLLIAESKCTSLKVSDLAQRSFHDLSKLILGTESMDCTEKQYWFDLVPSMTKKQTDSLFEILDTERQKLEALEIKYQDKIQCLNAKHLFEWNGFAYSKNKGTPEDLKSVKLSMFESAVDAIEACSELPKEIKDSLNELSAQREAIANSGKGSLILVKYYRSKPYNDPTRADSYGELAYRLSPDDWDIFSQYIRLLDARKDYKGGYEAIRQAIARGRLKELKGDSEKAIVRKVALYWQYLYFAEHSNMSADLSDIAVAGYNLSKLLLEKYPSYQYLKEITFFTGHLSQQLKDRKSLIGEYLVAISDVSTRLYSSKVISAEEYSYSSLNISWYCLFAENFKCTIDTARRGIEANPTYLPLYTNLAHGLLLSKKQNDAMAIYGKYIGKIVDGKKWEEIIQNDISRLTKYQVGMREFDPVRSIMRTSGAS